MSARPWPRSRATRNDSRPSGKSNLSIRITSEEAMMPMLPDPKLMTTSPGAEAGRGSRFRRQHWHSGVHPFQLVGFGLCALHNSCVHKSRRKNHRIPGFRRSKVTISLGISKSFSARFVFGGESGAVSHGQSGTATTGRIHAAAFSALHWRRLRAGRLQPRPR